MEKLRRGLLAAVASRPRVLSWPATKACGHESRFRNAGCSKRDECAESDEQFNRLEKIDYNIYWY